jgi:hypothetical protein
MYMLPFQSTHGPVRSSVQWKSSAIPVNRWGAQHTPVVRPPFTFGCNLWSGFKFSPGAHARPRAAAVGDDEVGLFGELVRAQHAVVLLLDPLCPCCDCNAPGPPMSCYACRLSE